MKRAFILAGSLFSIAITSMTILPSLAQDLQMRQRSVWDGTDTGPPAQRWTPGIEQQEYRRQQQILQGWQDAERRSYQTRVTPEHWLGNLQSKIQQAHAAGDYAGEAAAWSNLGDTIQAPGFGTYSQGISVWNCYKGEVGARLAHIQQVGHSDAGTEAAEWQKVRTLAIALSGHDPSDAQWPFLAGMSFAKEGPSSYNNARPWLTKCMNMPGCSADLKNKCQSELARMKAEEDRIRREAEERAARERAAQEETAKADDEAKRKYFEAASHVPDGVDPKHYREWLILEKGSKNSVNVAAAFGQEALRNSQWKEALFYMNQVIPYNKSYTWYTWRAMAEANLGQLDQAFDDTQKARELGADSPEFKQLEDQIKSHLHR